MLGVFNELVNQCLNESILPGMVKIARFHDTVISAEDVGEGFGHVIVIASDAVGVAVAFIQICRGFAVFAIGAVDSKAVEGVADEGRVFAFGVDEGGVNAFRINVIVISAELVRVAAAVVEDFVFSGIFALAVEGVVERDAVDGDADGAHGQGGWRGQRTGGCGESGRCSSVP